MRQLFAWSPDIGAQRTMKPLVEPTKFGDGYEARTIKGINSKPASWSVTFTKNVGDAIQILDFLELMGASEAFNWVDPLNKTGVYVCREWTSHQPSFGLYVVSGTFEQVFEYEN